MRLRGRRCFADARIRLFAITVRKQINRYLTVAGGLEWGPAGDCRRIARHLIACRLVTVVVGDRTQAALAGRKASFVCLSAVLLAVAKVSKFN